MTARTPAEAIAAVHRHGPAITAEQRNAALELLRDLLAAAAQHGVGLGDFNHVCDLPAACIDVVVAKTRRA
jgi:endonuclease/exonuclease/phosphatase family metal-dependent hydrolase